MSAKARRNRPRVLDVARRIVDGRQRVGSLIDEIWASTGQQVRRGLADVALDT